MSYLIFDIESIIDRVRVQDTEAKPGETPNETYDRVVKESCKEGGNICFVPARFHNPASFVALLVTGKLDYVRHVSCTDPLPAVVVRQFWDTLSASRRQALEYQDPLKLVSFNGSSFDLPVMQCAAMKHGIQMPGWLVAAQPWKDPRNAALTNETHLDLYNFLSGPGRAGGSLNFWCRLVGLPGKVSSNGGDVMEILNSAGGIAALEDYCSCDVANTFGLLVETLYASGELAYGHRHPSCLAVMETLLAGRGKECQAFLESYRTSRRNETNPLF